MIEQTGMKKQKLTVFFTINFIKKLIFLFDGDFMDFIPCQKFYIIFGKFSLKTIATMWAWESRLIL